MAARATATCIATRAIKSTRTQRCSHRMPAQRIVSPLTAALDLSFEPQAPRLARRIAYFGCLVRAPTSVRMVSQMHSSMPKHTCIFHPRCRDFVQLTTQRGPTLTWRMMGSPSLEDQSLRSPTPPAVISATKTRTALALSTFRATATSKAEAIRTSRPQVAPATQDTLRISSRRRPRLHLRARPFPATGSALDC